MSNNRKTEPKKVYQTWTIITMAYKPDEEFSVAELDDCLVQSGMMDAIVAQADTPQHIDWGSRLLQRNVAVKALNRHGIDWSPPYKIIKASGAGATAGGGTKAYVDATTYANGLALHRAKSTEVSLRGTVKAIKACEDELGAYMTDSARMSLANIRRDAEMDAEVEAFKSERRINQINAVLERERREFKLLGGSTN